MNSRVELLSSIAGGVDVIPTCLHIFELFIPKSFIKEVVIPQTNKSMADRGACAYLWRPIGVD